LVGALSLVVEGDEVFWVESTFKLAWLVFLQTFQNGFVDLGTVNELLALIASTFVGALKRSLVERF
jgi:beta-lactamase class A